MWTAFGKYTSLMSMLLLESNVFRSGAFPYVGKKDIPISLHRTQVKAISL